MSDKAKDLYSGFKKKILRSPSLSGAPPTTRRSSSGSFSLSGALSSFSLSSDRHSAARTSTSSLSAKGYGDADLSAAAAAAADEMFNDKPQKERRSSFSFATWKEKHRAKKAQKEAEKAEKYGAAATTPKGSRSDSRRERTASSSSIATPRGLAHSTPRGHGHGHAHTEPPRHTRSHSGRVLENGSFTSQGVVGRTRSNTSTTAPTREAQVRQDHTGRSRAASSASGPPSSSSSSSSYSFTARRQEKTRLAERASTMIVDDVATIVKPRPHTGRAPAPSWDSDSDDDDFEDSRAPRTRGFSRRSVSMDFMEPQQSNHLISKIWRKLPIQARLYGRGSIDLDLEKDRTSISRSSATKHLRRGDSSSDEYTIPTSPLPDENNVFGDKHIRFNHKITYTPAEGEYVALESYDDVLVRVCNFAAHDQRRTAIKVQEFLERSMCFMRGTSTKRGQKVSISNEEIRMWRRLARHDWESEVITTLDEEPTRKTHDKRSHSSSSVTEEETDDDEAVVSPDMNKIKQLCEVINYCLNTGDSLFTCEDVEELVTLELLVEEDGWI